MSHLTTLTLRQEPAVRVDLRGLTPTALAGLGIDEIERLELVHGRHKLPLAELFIVARSASAGDAPELRWVGNLARFDRLGWQMNGGRLTVEGSVGHYAGAGMTAGELTIAGSAGDLAACELAGGTLTIGGDVGDFAASTLPGSMDGMRGGLLVVRGRAGARFADRMRRGTALVFGDVGDFLASRMVAGTVAVGGVAGAHPGYGMRRGTVVFAGPTTPNIPVTFVEAVPEAPVFWQLLARDLARHGGAFAPLASRSPRRHLGDVAMGGKGELIVAG